jgi:hypothetical protein
MAGMKPLKENLKEVVLQALENHLGIVSPACKDAGISRDTFYRWYKEDEDFKKKVDEIDEVTLDYVESQLFRNIRSGSEKSIFFYMRYKARKRGYTEELNINANVKVEQPLLLPLKRDEDEKNED